MIKKDIHRENSRRQHRSVALFLTIQCWLRGIDSIRITKEELKSLLNLKKLESERKNWIEDDFGEFFFHFEIRRYQNRENPSTSTEYFIFSRIDTIKKYGRKMGLIPKYESIDGVLDFQSIFNDSNLNEQESYVSCYLGLLSQGQISPKSMSISDRNIEFELYKGNLLYDYYRDFVDKCFQKNLGEFKFYNDLSSSRKHTPRMSNTNLKELEILFGELFSKYKFMDGFIQKFFGITQEMYFAKDEETDENKTIFFNIGPNMCQLVSRNGNLSGLVTLQSLKIVSYSSLSEEERNNLGWQNGLAFWDLPKKLQFQAFNDLQGREFVRFIKANVEKFKERGYLD